MDFSLTTVYVLPTGNVLATSGTNANLAAKQFSVFRPDYTPATNANIAATKWIMFSQGRVEGAWMPWLGTKNSDKIYSAKVTGWYKSTGEDTAAVQITDFSNFTARCGEQVSISLRMLSYYIDVTYYNGLTRSFTYDTPCCDCDGNPCDTLDATETQNMVDWFVNRINNENTVKRFVTAERIGTGLSSILRITGKALDQYGNPCDLVAFPYQYDRMYFYGFAYVGSPTTQDLQFYYDRCEQFATVTVTQRSSYPRGTYDQVVQMEKDYWSYQVDRFKDLHDHPRYNQAFVSYAESGVTYDQYVLEFETPDKYTWASYVPQDERVILFVPQGQTATLETMLVTKFGAIENKSAPDISTTTTTSTSSSTTSTTTTLIFP